MPIEDKTKEFLKKHKPIDVKDVKKRLEQYEQAKIQHTTNMVEIEQNLREFENISDPLVYNGKVLCYVKRCNREEYESFTPPEMRKYANSGEKVPKEVLDKYEGNIYNMMAKLIVDPNTNQPIHDASFWKKKPVIFTVLFQNHLFEIYELMGIEVENF